MITLKFYGNWLYATSFWLLQLLINYYVQFKCSKTSSVLLNIYGRLFDVTSFQTTPRTLLGFVINWIFCIRLNNCFCDLTWTSFIRLDHGYRKSVTYHSMQKKMTITVAPPSSTKICVIWNSVVPCSGVHRLKGPRPAMMCRWKCWFFSSIAAV